MSPVASQRGGRGDWRRERDAGKVRGGDGSGGRVKREKKREAQALTEPFAFALHCGRRYLILDVLGQGTFGQVVKCQNMKTNEVVAVKVIKNKPAYFNQSMMEVAILEEVSWHSFRT